MQSRVKRGGIAAVVLLISLLILAGPVGAATCTSLSGLVLPQTTITAIQSFAGGIFTAPDGELFSNMPAFCRVAATLTPVASGSSKPASSSREAALDESLCLPIMPSERSADGDRRAK